MPWYEETSLASVPAIAREAHSAHAHATRHIFARLISVSFRCFATATRGVCRREAYGNRYQTSVKQFRKNCLENFLPPKVRRTDRSAACGPVTTKCRHTQTP